MREHGITVSFYDPEKKNKRMKAYQEYIARIRSGKSSEKRNRMKAN